MASGGINQQEMETKAMESSVEGLISRAKELKNALELFLAKIEHNHTMLNWPTVLDSFALLSSQITNIIALLKNEKIAPLQNFSVIPYRLSQDNDPELETLTEGRLPALPHNVVPNYLRTKPGPEVEKEEKQLFAKANSVDEVQAKNFNKLCDKMLEKIDNSPGFRSEQSAFKSLPITHNPKDTMMLIGASTYGKGLNNFKASQPDINAPMSSHINLQTKMMPNVKMGNVYSRP